MSELSQPSRVDRTCLHTGFLHPSFPGTHTPTHLFIHWVSVCGSAGLQTLVNTRQAWASRAEGPVGRPCPLRLMGRRRGGGASGKGWRLQETLCRDVWGGTDTPETRDVTGGAPVSCEGRTGAEEGWGWELRWAGLTFSAGRMLEKQSLWDWGGLEQSTRNRVSPGFPAAQRAKGRLRDASLGSGKGWHIQHKCPKSSPSFAPGPGRKVSVLGWHTALGSRVSLHL